MVCIYCGSPTRVSNSRAQKRLQQVWRRRTCERCHAVFTTHEQADLANGLRITFPDGSLRPFERDQLYISVYEALGHRSDATTAASDLTTTITSLLLKTAQRARLNRTDVITVVHTTLRRFDVVAATYYHARHN